MYVEKLKYYVETASTRQSNSSLLKHTRELIQMPLQRDYGFCHQFRVRTTSGGARSRNLGGI